MHNRRLFVATGARNTVAARVKRNITSGVETQQKRYKHWAECTVYHRGASMLAPQNKLGNPVDHILVGYNV